MALILAAVLVMGYDASKDGGSDPTVETDGNDEYFQWPQVNDDERGHIEMEHRGQTVAFSAMANPGYQFVRWMYQSGETYSESMQIEFPIGSVQEVIAEFRVLEGNMVLEYHWEMPMFGDEGVTATAPETFTTVIDSMD